MTQHGEKLECFKGAFGKLMFDGSGEMKEVSKSGFLLLARVKCVLRVQA